MSTIVMHAGRRVRLVALAAGLSLVTTACSADGDPVATDVPAETTADASDETTSQTAASENATDSSGGTETTERNTGTTTGDPVGDGGIAESGAVAMTVTIDLDPEAVWEDGTPITAADLECTWRAYANTPGSITTAGYDQIRAVSAGDRDKQVIVEFSEVFGPYKTLFNPILKAESVADCDDVSAEFSAEQPVSARPYRIESWTEGEVVLVPNENYWGDDEPVAQTVVMVPQRDTPTEIASLRDGQVDFIYPRFSESLATVRDDPNIEIAVVSGGDYEALYFQQLEGPFADPVFRAAFSMSIDRQALYAQIYEPIFAATGAEGELLNCGPVVAGPFCPEGNFEDTFDPASAATMLTDAGWQKDGSGFWAKDGTAPRIVWVVNTGDVRREQTQDYLIPVLAEAGFDVVADNCDAACVFDQRVPSLDYDLAMYISPARPDPTYLTPLFTCENIPTEENDFAGRNHLGWCNREASDALQMADRTVDEEERIDLVQGALRAMATDHVLLPLVNFPKSGAWRTDRVSGPIGAELGNDRAFSNFQSWEDTDGDGRVVIGAGQLPSCLNPVTECADSSWYGWTVSFPTLPGVWDTTADQMYEITNLVLEEPTVELAE